MLLPASAVLDALALEISRLPMDSAGLEGSASQSIRAALNLLINRERGGSALLRTQCDALAMRIARIASEIDLDDTLREGILKVQEALQLARSSMGLQEQEFAWHTLLRTMEAFMESLTEAGGLSRRTRARLQLELVQWEAEDLARPMRDSLAPRDALRVDVTLERLNDYLRARFTDSSLAVTLFRSLPGGFGKQTFLFDMQSADLSGSFVLRRDLAIPLLTNDCHQAAQEFALIRAVRALGFPAPDAVWLDTEHHLLPGGDFFVMRKSSGVPGGSVFRAQADVPASLAQVLAEMLARLHALPPMPQLDKLTESLNSATWAMPLEQCIRQYLERWLSMFRREEHLPSPAIVSLLSWLLEHIPDMGGKPVLLHGDIGFHNFLFDQGSLTAVLDWEFGHLGDPAEDLAYVRNTLGKSLNWENFISVYREAGGIRVDEQRLRFWQVWGHVRNACASNLVASKLAFSQIDEVKLVLLPHVYIPQMLNAAYELIAQFW